MAEYVVVIPTYNEAETIRKAVSETLAIDERLDILVVDDNSPDGTGQIADELAAANERIKVLHRETKEGLGPAYIAGYRWAIDNNYEFLIGMDADGSHRPADLPKLLRASRDADLVIGSRYIPGAEILNWPFHRLLLSRFGNWYARTLLGSKIRDITAGFRVYRVSVLKRLDLGSIQARGYAFQINLTQMIAKSDGTIVEVPITFIERTLAKSKMTKRIVFEAFWLVLKWAVTGKN
ncbi:MAG: polyprenol monophosphomannose synthase [Micrococcales bacterium]